MAEEVKIDVITENRHNLTSNISNGDCHGHFCVAIFIIIVIIIIAIK